MKKDNWRFEALVRAKIIRQEEETKVTQEELCLGCYQSPCKCLPNDADCDPE